MIKDHPTEQPIHFKPITPIQDLGQETITPITHRIEDDAVIDEILNTLREEENAAHE